MPIGWLSAEWQQLCICNKSHCDPFVFCFYCALPACSAHSSKVAICCHDSRYCAGWGPPFSRAPAPGSSPTLPPCVPLISRVSSLSFFLSFFLLLFSLLPLCSSPDWVTSAVSQMQSDVLALSSNASLITCLLTLTFAYCVTFTSESWSKGYSKEPLAFLSNPSTFTL